MNIPQHIGFIMDGNRRFAKRLMLEPWKGHEVGEETFQKVIHWLGELDIKEATFYAFSRQNFNRPKQEFDHLMRIFVHMAKKLLEEEKIQEYDIRVRFVGATTLFPEEVQRAIAAVEEKTKHATEHTVNMAFGYGGREELIEATKKIAQQVKHGMIDPSSIDESTIQKHLTIASEPDMIIRTGGEHRTSNFLPWQSTYSEWFFLDKMWPELTKEDIISCIDTFNDRERRFGK
jgi:tritrans,polycis-undecaprenyl-diphosphate synthase [geranylgeranyl-diphosphate specific]